MADTFAYRVRDKGGKVRSGTLEADSQALVADRLRTMGYVPLAIERRSSGTGGLRRELRLPGLSAGGGVKLRDTVVATRQLATMLDAGLPIVRSLAILAEQTPSKALARTLVEVRTDVEKGSSFSHALARHPRAFSRLYVAMVRAGEVGGILDTVLDQLATTIEKQLALRSRVRAAMTYPIAVLGLISVIVVGMLVFVVPKFESLYANLGGTLPLPTRILLMVSGAAVWLVPLGVLGVFVALFGFRRLRATPAGRLAIDRVTLKVPILGRVVHKTALARLARTLSVLLSSGVPILDALEICGETVGNQVVARALRDAQLGVQVGEPLARPLARHAVIPPMVSQMLAVGEETGAIDTLLGKVGDFYDTEVESLVEGLTSLLEPAMVVTLGLTVGSMVLALYLPMFRIITLVQ